MHPVLPNKLEYTTIPPKIGFFQVVQASYMMDMTLRFRYKANLIGDVIRSALFILVFWLFAGAYTFKTGVTSERETLLFFISGFLFIMFDGVALWTPLNVVNRDLYNGTLEYLFSNPFNRVAYFVGVVLASATTSSVMIVPILLFLILTGMVTPISLGMIILDLGLMTVVLVAFGTMFSLMALLWKQVGSLAGVVGMFFQFLSGFFFPVTLIPDFIKPVAFALPYTWAIDLARYYAFGKSWNTILPVYQMWGILCIFVVMYWTLTMVLIRKVERKSKAEGLHLI